MIFRTATLAVAAVFTFSAVGCVDEPGPAVPPVMSDGHDDHDHGGHAKPETFAEAFAEVCEHRDEIRDAFADDDADAAHGPLHDIGNLLNTASELADASDLSAEAKTSVKSDIKVAFDAFLAVDKKMHGDDDGKDYSEVSAEIDAALTAIASTAGPLAESDGHGDHGHDHKAGDHDSDHKEADHKEADHKEADHKDGDHKDGDHEESPEPPADAADEKPAADDKQE